MNKLFELISQTNCIVLPQIIQTLCVRWKSLNPEAVYSSVRSSTRNGDVFILWLRSVEAALMLMTPQATP